MEFERSLPRSQEPATGAYPKPHESIPRPHHISLSFLLILSSHVVLGLPSVLFASGKEYLGRSIGEVQPNKRADVSREMICRMVDATSDIADSGHRYEQIFTVYRAISNTYSTSGTMSTTNPTWTGLMCDENICSTSKPV